MFNTSNMCLYILFDTAKFFTTGCKHIPSVCLQELVPSIPLSISMRTIFKLLNGVQKVFIQKLFKKNNIDPFFKK